MTQEEIKAIEKELERLSRNTFEARKAFENFNNINKVWDSKGKLLDGWK